MNDLKGSDFTILRVKCDNCNTEQTSISNPKIFKLPFKCIKCSRLLYTTIEVLKNHSEVRVIPNNKTEVK